MSRKRKVALFTECINDEKMKPPTANKVDTKGPHAGDPAAASAAAAPVSAAERLLLNYIEKMKLTMSPSPNKERAEEEAKRPDEAFYRAIPPAPFDVTRAVLGWSAGEFEEPDTTHILTGGLTRTAKERRKNAVELMRGIVFDSGTTTTTTTSECNSSSNNSGSVYINNNNNNSTNSSSSNNNNNNNNSGSGLKEASHNRGRGRPKGSGKATATSPGQRQLPATPLAAAAQKRHKGSTAAPQHSSPLSQLARESSTQLGDSSANSGDVKEELSDEDVDLDIDDDENDDDYMAASNSNNNNNGSGGTKPKSKKKRHRIINEDNSTCEGGVVGVKTERGGDSEAIGNDDGLGDDNEDMEDDGVEEGLEDEDADYLDYTLPNKRRRLPSSTASSSAPSSAKSSSQLPSTSTHQKAKKVSSIAGGSINNKGKNGKEQLSNRYLNNVPPANSSSAYAFGLKKPGQHIVRLFQPTDDVSTRVKFFVMHNGKSFACNPVTLELRLVESLYYSGKNTKCYCCEKPSVCKDSETRHYLCASLGCWEKLCKKHGELTS